MKVQLLVDDECVGQLETENTFSIPIELLHFLYIMDFGAGKYEADNWLKPDGTKADNKSNFGSIFRHVAEGYAGQETDDESGMDPVLHAMCRLGFGYTRKMRGLDNG